jgi:hypothetical protein
MEVLVENIALYEADRQRWLAHTVAQLQAQNFAHLDWENLIEELESLGRSEKQAIASYLMRLCEHLLKVAYWETERERCFRGWDVEITHFRLQIQERLRDSPSLKTWLAESFPRQYRNGRKLFLKASQLPASQVAETPVFTLEQALDEDWLPWQPLSWVTECKEKFLP